MAPSQEVTLTTRVRVWYDGLPLFTRVVFLVLCAVYILQLLTGWGDVSTCLSPHLTIEKFQVYRLLTSLLFHVGLLHVAFNLLAFVPMGTSLERELGTLQFGYLVLLISLLEGLVYILMGATLTATHLYPSALYQCATGFSGVIFGLIVVDNATTHTPLRSIFGLFSVPSAAYPWALLVFWQLLMPGVSFLGHLSGVLVGQAYVSGYLKPFEVPRSKLLEIEDSEFAMHYLTRWPSFMMVPGPSLPVSIIPSSPGNLGRLDEGSGSPVAGGSGFSGILARNLGQWFWWPGQGYSSVGGSQEGQGGGVYEPSSAEKKFQGHGYQLGGASARAQQAAKAAAAAAEARMMGSAGVSVVEAGSSGSNSVAS